MVNKRITSILLLLALALFILPVTAVDSQPLILDEQDLSFTVDAQVFSLGSPIAPMLSVLNTLGEVEITEADSCLFAGKDKEFYAGGLLVGSLPRGEKGADLVETIMVLEGDFLTARGIGIGSPGDEVYSAYGQPTLTDYDLLIYALDDALDGPQLVFVMDLEQDTVISYYYFLNTQG